MTSSEPDKLEQDLNYAKSMAKYIRWFSWIAVAMVALWCVQKFQHRVDYPFPWVIGLTWIYSGVYCLWMLFPWAKVESAKVWKIGMIGFTLLSFFFVFLLIGNVMIDAIAASREGVKLGVPGFEGTLMFFSLAQVPAMLFRRHPEMMV